MRHRLLLLVLLTGAWFVSCNEKDNEEIRSDSAATEPSAQKEPLREEHAEFGTFFADAGVEGSFTLYDARNNRYLLWNPERSATAFIPASTFKIFNSLVALETGVIKDENEEIEWDGVERQIPAWNRTHTLRSAIQHSVVWFYQELARRIGQERMQAWIDSVGYGNQDISGGIDRFWLDGGLRISPEEQIAFLIRLKNNDLPFSQRTMDIVKDIMILERTEDYIYRGKTGWALRDSSDIGWFVGYLERGDSTWFFATNLAMEGEKDIAHRKEITWKILESLGLTKSQGSAKTQGE